MAAPLAESSGTAETAETAEASRFLRGRLFSVGHSNNEADQFFKLLDRHNVKELVDVRSIPSSGKFPHFKRSALQQLCQRRGISYRHCPQLGNKGVDGGILALLATEDGAAALEKLAATASEATLMGPKTAIMCAEADWHECHRQVVAQRLLESFGVVVAHIKRDGSLEQHPQNHVLPPYFGAKVAPRFASAYSAEALCCAEPAAFHGYPNDIPTVPGPLGPLQPGPSSERNPLQAPHPPSASPASDAPPEVGAKPKRRWGRV